MARYVVILSAYLWAESDDEARQKANEYAEHLKQLDDNHATADSLYLPFGIGEGYKVEIP